MSTGPEHYTRAESAMELAKDSQPGSEKERFFLAIAQVHATLALAAAMGTFGTADENRSVEDVKAWEFTAGEYTAQKRRAAEAAPADEFADCLPEQLDGTACMNCARDFTEGQDTQPVGNGPRGQLFVHADGAVCKAVAK